MPDIPECVEAGAVQASEKEAQAREYFRRDIESTLAAMRCMAERRRLLAQVRRDADRRRRKAGCVFARRVVAFLAFNVLMCVLWILGWIVPGLAAFLVGMSCTVFAFWFGAWAQFIFAREGQLL